MAANTDLFREHAPLFNTTLNGSIGSTDTTITLQSVVNLPTTTAVTLTIDGVDANGAPTPLLREVIIGIVNALDNTIIDCLRGQDNTTAQGHDNGAIVQDDWTAKDTIDLVTGLTNTLTQAGIAVTNAIPMVAITTTFLDGTTNPTFQHVITSGDITAGYIQLAFPHGLTYIPRVFYADAILASILYPLPWTQLNNTDAWGGAVSVYSIDTTYINVHIALGISLLSLFASNVGNALEFQFWCYK